ncbi:hypothetical protein MTR67_025480 [Solanum verrucosum]|uniref:Uncharacterized protein n=1 Tax=Solanum verrucosum TaxID=315347 RepID=A0AAF0TYU4_SOLVR|nr:hypothetical protein MTR67_025480 [Solanum verrucosum]
MAKKLFQKVCRAHVEQFLSSTLEKKITPTFLKWAEHINKTIINSHNFISDITPIVQEMGKTASDNFVYKQRCPTLQ